MQLTRLSLLICVLLATTSLTTCCAEDEWKCDSGQCLAIEKLCDGDVDCKDGSDERPNVCIGVECPSYAFRCAYGACVMDDYKCDGISHCADGSDESRTLCENDAAPTNSLCQHDQFECEFGECIDLEKTCDGRYDCENEADESLECASIECPHYAFRCDYGACILANKKCNGVPDCVDRSDENPKLCPSTTTAIVVTTTVRPPPSNCTAPTIPDAILRYEAKPSMVVMPGDPIEHGVTITYGCRRGYNLLGTDINICLNSTWTDPSQPSCIKYCPPLNGVTFSVICEYEDESVPCGDQIRPGTRATVSCRDKYRKVDPGRSNILVCLSEGNWDYAPYHCEPICGEIPVRSTAFIAHAPTSNITEVPWHVGIYENFSTRYRHICGGSIIGAKIIITAAHCFWDNANEKLYDKSHFAVAAGKYYRDYYHYETAAQKRNISVIKVPANFQGESAQYAHDIAVVILTDFLRFNTFISPICIEWKSYSEMSIASNATGHVAGWGMTESGTFSEELRSSDLVTSSYARCIFEAGPLSSAVHSDKFCVFNRFGTVVCQGDSGGGFGLQKSERYYLWGVVSGGVPRGKTCPEVSFTLYTNIQFYRELIESIAIANRPH